MFFIIATILLALSFLTNKLQKTISILALAVDAFLVAYPAVRHNADYNLYKLSYSQQLDNFEKGYTFLAKLFFNWGASYETFRVYIACATFIIFGIAIFRLSKNPSLVVLAFNVGLFAIEAIQIRNMIMLALALLGFSMLKQGQFANIVLGFLVLVIATSFHTLGYFFLLGGILFFIPWDKLIKGLKVVAIVSFPVSILFLIFGVQSIQSAFGTFLSITGARSDFSFDLVSVYNNGIGFNAWLLTVFIVAILLLPFCLNSTSVRNFLNDPKSKNVLVTAFLSVFSVVLTLLSSDYVRLVRDASVFSYIAYSQLVEKLSYKRFIILIYVFVIACFVFWLQNFIIYPESGRYIGYTIGLISDSVFQ